MDAIVQYDQLHLGFQISAFSLGITILLFTLIQKRTEKIQNKHFLFIALILMVCSLSDIVTALSDPRRFAEPAALAVSEASRTVYFIMHNVLSIVFYYYVQSVCNFYSSKRKIHNAISTAFAVLLEIPVLINPFAHLLFYYDDNMIYRRGVLMAPVMVIKFIYFGASIMILMRSWSALTSKRRAALGYFFLVIMAGITVQFFFINIKIEILAETIGLLGMMVAVEDEDEWIDYDLECYNRMAFRIDLLGFRVYSDNVLILGLHITNSENIIRIIGTGSADRVFTPVSKFLHTVVNNDHVYSISRGTFAVVISDASEEDVQEMISKIRIRFGIPFDVGGRKMLFNAVVSYAYMPERISNVSEACYMLDNPPHDTGKFIYKDEDLDYLLRRRALEKAVTVGLAKGSFEVHYQPTYDINGRIHGAEALVRMHDDELGDVFPDEFIPLAEELGIIGEIDDFVLATVCRFLNMSRPFGLKLDCINVNLSVIQCMETGFVDHINSIVEDSGIDKSLINFEITESVAASDYKLLGKVISDLRSYGYRFSMDDYGTGYSNMNAVIALDLDVIKIDKSILWAAEESELGYIILENNVRMIRQTKRKILVEGVETASQLELCRKLNVDYLQGYYFSRPVPEMIFTQKLGQA
ncbi:MAG: EAL domain-containing protein [Oscillospiraceae bacterium]|nr:EAL domain-containing protein [Oscillospiraceae bacterium]